MVLPDTKPFKEQHGGEGGETGIDDQLRGREHVGKGAWIFGRNMFGPIRGPWPDDEWKGWWGDEPPYQCRDLCADASPTGNDRDEGR